MSTSTIFQPHDFDANQFVFTAVKPNSFGGKAAFINFEKHNVRIETPKMLCRWGIGTYPPNDPNPTSYSIQVEFPKDMDEKMKQFHGNMELLDEVTMRTAIERCKDWLGKATLNETSAKEFYSPILIKHLDEKNMPTGKYPDSIRLKLPVNKDGRFSTKCFNQKKEPVELKDAVQKGCYIKAIIELNGVSLKKNAYSLSCKALQLQVYPPVRFTGYAFLPDEDDDENFETVSLVSNDVEQDVSERDGKLEREGKMSDTLSRKRTMDDSEQQSELPSESQFKSMGESMGESEQLSENRSKNPADQGTDQTTDKGNDQTTDQTTDQPNSDEEIPSPQPKKRSKFTKKK